MAAVEAVGQPQGRTESQDLAACLRRRRDPFGVRRLREGLPMIAHQIGDQLDLVRAPTRQTRVAHDVRTVFVVPARGDRTPDVVEEGGREEDVAIAWFESGNICQ